MDNFITGSPQNIKKLQKYPKFKFIKHDITKPFPKSFEFQISNFKFIYHLACPTGVPNLGPLAEEMLLTCSLGTRNILELAKEHKSKVLFSSSSEVYGDPKVFPQDESYTGNVDPTGLRSPYEEGKRFAESLMMMYQRKYKVPVRVARVFNTYGPYMAFKDGRVISKFLYQALSSKSLTIHGQGLQRRTFLYVDDLVKGLNLVMEEGKTGQVYNLGSNQEISILELAQTILDLTKTKSSFRFVKRPTHDHQSRLPNLEKVNKLGWYPKTGLRDGLLKTISFFKKGE